MGKADPESTLVVIGVENASLRTQIVIAVEISTSQENPMNTNKAKSEEGVKSTDNQLAAFWESVSNAPPVTFFTSSPKDTITYEEYRARRIQHILASSAIAR